MNLSFPPKHDHFNTRWLIFAAHIALILATVMLDFGTPDINPAQIGRSSIWPFNHVAENHGEDLSNCAVATNSACSHNAILPTEYPPLTWLFASTTLLMIAYTYQAITSLVHQLKNIV